MLHGEELRAMLDKRFFSKKIENGITGLCTLIHFDDENLKNELINKISKPCDIIWYPGCGGDLFPCEVYEFEKYHSVVHDKADNRLYLYTDPDQYRLCKNAFENQKFYNKKIKDFELIEGWRATGLRVSVSDTEYISGYYCNFKWKGKNIDILYLKMTMQDFLISFIRRFKIDIECLFYINMESKGGQLFPLYEEYGMEYPKHLCANRIDKFKLENLAKMRPIQDDIMFGIFYHKNNKNNKRNTNLNGIDKNELFRLLKTIEIPVGTDTNDGKFRDLKRLYVIQDEVENSNLNYRYINGKNNYFKLYGQDSLEKLSKEFEKIVLVSSHSDNWQPESVYEEYDKTIKGIFDNASTNAVCVYIMKYINLPRNVIFAFTSDEECKSEGAKHLAKKLTQYFGKGGVDVITLDVTYGWCNGADFSIENDYFYKKYDGDGFAKKICETANRMGYKWQFIKAADDCKSKNPDEYILSTEIEKYMGAGLISVDQYSSSDEGADESADYDENDFSAFSLCLPCSANTCKEMHDEAGFEISKQVISNYTDFLAEILKTESY